MEEPNNLDLHIADDEADIPEDVNTVYQPIYKQIGSARIPVSKYIGKHWKLRIDEGMRLLKNSGTIDRWDEAIKAYERDHTSRASKRRKLSKVGKYNASDVSNLYSTENIVYSNISALIPSIYAKNPDVEASVANGYTAEEGVVEAIEDLINALFQRKYTPGLGLKSKLKRMVGCTLLTNVHYCMLKWVRKEDSSEQAYNDIDMLSRELQNAKDIKEIESIEGKLIALDNKINVLEPSGPKLITVRPHYVIEDPDNVDGDFVDNRFIAVGQFIRTSVLHAMYYNEQENGDQQLIFQPTHVIPKDEDSANINGHDEELTSFKLLRETTKTDNMRTAGYTDEREYDDACRTLTWEVWDKVTRRVYLFSEADWTWPLWVWDDPYRLSRFYPVFRLSTQTPIDDRHGKSEVMYYLDQQDEINVINEERARMRHWASSKFFYDINSVKDRAEVEKIISPGTDKALIAIDLPDGKTIENIIGTIKAPSTNVAQLFDESTVLASVNRLSSVTPVLQSQQYKTNTTNRAIESYESTTATRLDEKIDAVEELLSELAYALFEMCIQFFSVEDIAELIGDEKAQMLAPMIGSSPESIRNKFFMTMVGGSTNKPTSKVKKEQALNLGQVLGQFANASPMIVIILLKAMERAFSDDVVITDEEWQMIIQATQAQMQRGNSQPGSQQGAEGQSAQGNSSGGIEEQLNKILQDIGARFDQLPTKARDGVAQAFASGATFQEILQAVMQIK